MFLWNCRLPKNYHGVCTCMCTCTWTEEETRSWKISPQKISPFTSVWSHSEKWILRWEHYLRVKSTEPPIFKKITQRSPYLCHLAEAVKHWTSFYLSWLQPGRKRMKLSKHKRGDSVHSKPGLAWGQSPKSPEQQETMRWEQGCFWGALFAFLRT